MAEGASIEHVPSAVVDDSHQWIVGRRLLVVTVVGALCQAVQLIAVIEGEERLAAFGLAANDADGLLGPEPGDQPSVFLGALGETPSGLDRQQGHLRCLAVLASGTGGAAHSSRNSFSSMWRASRCAATLSNSPEII